MAINDKLNGKTNKKKTELWQGKSIEFIENGQFIANIWDKQLRKVSNIRWYSGAEMRGTMFVFHMHYTVRFRSVREQWTAQAKTH